MSRTVKQKQELEVVSPEQNGYGAWVVSAIVNGYRVSRQYYGYTKAEAVTLFKEEVEITKVVET